MVDLFTKLGSGLVLLLIFLSQFVPTAYSDFKALILIISVICVVVALLEGSLYLLTWQILGIILLVFIALLFSTYGMARGNPGAMRVLSVWVAWPLIYLLFSSLLVNVNSFAWLSKTFIFSLSSIVLYTYMYLGNSIGVIPDWLYVNLDQGQIVGFYDGFVEYSLYSISSLIFLVPFAFHYYLERYKRSSKVGIKSWILILASLLLVVLTGRRAMQLTLLLFPFIVFCVNVFLGNRYKLLLGVRSLVAFVLLCLLVVMVLQYFGLSYEVLERQFFDGFDFSSSNSSASERTIQFHSLVNGWLETSLLFGAGNGAAASISRSHEFPWAYELTYIYLIFSTGILGTLFFFGWYAFGLLKVRQSIVKRPDLIVFAAPMLTASISFCVAAASNPYFGKFDYLWIVLLPFLVAGWVKNQKECSCK